MEIETYKEALTVTGAILGIIAFSWKLWDFLWVNLFSHLQLNLNIVQVAPSLLKITTEIENKGSVAKKINYAFLLISPEGSYLKESLNAILNTTMNINDSTSTPVIFKSIAKERYNEKLLSPDGDHLLLPLEYYYQEQIHIGNEKIKYAVSQSVDSLKAKSYTVRFIIISMHLMNSYLRYRSTSDTIFNIKKI